MWGVWPCGRVGVTLCSFSLSYSCTQNVKRQRSQPKRKRDDDDLCERGNEGEEGGKGKRV